MSDVKTDKQEKAWLGKVFKKAAIRSQTSLTHEQIVKLALDRYRLRQDNERLRGELSEKEKVWAKIFTDLKSNHAADLHARDKALVEAVELLSRDTWHHKQKDWNEFQARRKSFLSTLNSLLGDECGVATPPPDNQKGGS